MTAEVAAVCSFSDNRIYLLVEKVINVSSNTNPHPVYFVKEHLPNLRAGHSDAAEFPINEPVGTEADFLVISVTNAGQMALRRHQVVDHGILHLPKGTRQESEMKMHIKT